MDECMAQERSFNRCHAALVAMNGAVERELSKLDTSLVFKEGSAEAVAWETCGSPVQASSREHLNLILGCSFQKVAEAQLLSFIACTATGHECQEERAALIREARPYMEKVYVKEPAFLLRGTILTPLQFE